MPFFLLSLLVHQQSRRRMLLIGGVFVTSSGLDVFRLYGGLAEPLPAHRQPALLLATCWR
ncbi:MAG: hypothetical protein IPJ50_23045 [Betaproteobacteria bacterium]|nr:hypothetical protein [Betaproteobacteria bacterium]